MTSAVSSLETPAIICNPTTIGDPDRLLTERLLITAKEVDHVQQKTESVDGLFLRRLAEAKQSQGVGPLGSTPLTAWDRFPPKLISKKHQAIVSHAVAVQLYAYSAGATSTPDLIAPLWITVLLEGRGLRRMSGAHVGCADRLMRVMAQHGIKDIGQRFIRDPWTAYRLGLGELALSLLPGSPLDKHERDELALRVELASGSLGEGAQMKIDHLAAPHGSDSRIGLIASLMAYTTKEGGPSAPAWTNELKSWVALRLEEAISPQIAPLMAQVMNALNLIHLRAGEFNAIEERMERLLARVTPVIDSPRTRAHIEGNAHYQRSILARRRGQASHEISHLLAAMESDLHFSTLYYRLAQTLHDQGDGRAAQLYELAIALSPLDYPLANDYGCFLLETNQTADFESWSQICRLLFPENFEEAQA